jgi:uncharacterized transporter YbjL
MQTNKHSRWDHDINVHQVYRNLPPSSDTPTIAYAAVYPLTMLLRILCAQVLALIPFR